MPIMKVSIKLDVNTSHDSPNNMVLLVGYLFVLSSPVVTLLCALSQLYVGLWYESHGNPEAAKTAIMAAISTPYARQSGKCLGLSPSNEQSVSGSCTVPLCTVSGFSSR